MEMIAIRRVKLEAHHLQPGRTKHTLHDANGIRPFPPFTSLAIARYGDDAGYYLMHICADRTGTDTWHQTLEDAFDQAEWEFGVRRNEWTEVREPF
jgi:hypothetical protein